MPRLHPQFQGWYIEYSNSSVFLLLMKNILDDLLLLCLTAGIYSALFSRSKFVRFVEDYSDSGSRSHMHTNIITILVLGMSKYQCCRKSFIQMGILFINFCEHKKFTVQIIPQPTMSQETRNYI